MISQDTIYICEVTIWDPESQAHVVMEIHKDAYTNAIFGVESSYLDQVSQFVRDPYNGKWFRCVEPKE